MSDTSGQTRRAWIVRGRVQGVGFRGFVEVAAVQAKLSGWVRNLSDGSVEVVAAGAEDSLERLEKQLWEGPWFARVDNVENIDVPHEIDMSKTFEIR